MIAESVTRCQALPTDHLSSGMTHLEDPAQVEVAM